MKEICFKLHIMVEAFILVSHQQVWNTINVAILSCRKMQKEIIKKLV